MTEAHGEHCQDDASGSAAGRARCATRFRVLRSDEVVLVRELLEELADYHNRNSRDFAGCFPIVPIDRHLGDLAELVACGQGRVEALFLGDEIVGFGAATFEGGYGEVEYLYVKAELRGRNYGGRLLESMLRFLRDNGVGFVDIKVSRDNPAKRLYKRHGFIRRAETLSMRLGEDPLRSEKDQPCPESPTGN